MRPKIVREGGQEIVLQAISILKCFNLETFSKVTSDFQKSAECAVLSPQRRDDHASPKSGSVFFDSPGLSCVLPLFRGSTKSVSWRVTLNLFLSIKNRNVLTNNFFGLVSRNPLRSSIPADDIAFGTKKNDCVILHA